MLAELTIRNYALIDSLALELGPGLNVLTGETGAGKSIILGALSLVLGERADTDLIRTGEKEALVEARFCSLPSAVTGILEELDISIPDQSLILRRRLDRTGKSSAYANDSGITVTALHRLGDHLVDLHGQHQHQLLLRPEAHLEILDRYGRLTGRREEFGREYGHLLGLRTELAELEKDLTERRARRDLIEYQAKELSSAGIKPGELAELRREREQLSTAEKRYSLACELEDVLSEQEPSACGLVSAAMKKLAELAGIDPTFVPYQDTLAAASAQLDDLWREVVSYRDRIQFSPERSEEVNARLFLIEKLEKKYGLTADELPALQEKLSRELDSSELDQTRCEDLRRQIAGLEKTLLAEARRLSATRRQAAEKLRAKLATEFSALGLEKARLTAHVTAPETPGPESLAPTGFDSVEFLFSANPGEELKPLRKVASGGELSRIMLGLKNVLTGAGLVPTMVFDEIDTGIGGRVAEAVGKRLSRLGRTQQVVCITHLPQIAKYADNHFLVTKQTRKGRFLTAITRLNREGRVRELARMVAGEAITETSLVHARQMMKDAAQ